MTDKPNKVTDYPMLSETPGALLETVDPCVNYEKKRKLKYVVNLAKHFPKGHRRAGEETMFKEKVIAEEKLHTIRGNYALWEKRFKKIYAGEAELHITEWTGEPYNSKKSTIGVAVTPHLAKLTFEGGFCFINESACPVEYKGSLELIAENDGLSVEDFGSWFVDKKTGMMPTKDLAMIWFGGKIKY